MKYTDSALMHQMLKTPKEVHYTDRLKLNSLIVDLCRALKDPLYNSYYQSINELISEIDALLQLRCIKWHDHPSMIGIKDLLENTLPGWKFSSPLCPGKTWHYTFEAKKDDLRKVVHIHETTHEVIVEDIK